MMHMVVGELFLAAKINNQHLSKAKRRQIEKGNDTSMQKDMPKKTRNWPGDDMRWIITIFKCLTLMCTLNHSPIFLDTLSLCEPLPFSPSSCILVSTCFWSYKLWSLTNQQHLERGNSHQARFSWPIIRMIHNVTIFLHKEWHWYRWPSPERKDHSCWEIRVMTRDLLSSLLDWNTTKMRL